MHQPAASPCPDTEIHYWCEHVTYRSLGAAGSDIEKVERHSARTPAEAIRQTRSSIRDLASTLPPNEHRRALSWADGGGCVGAVAGLHRDSLSVRTVWMEWTVHPYHVFPIPAARRLLLVPH